MRDSAGITPDFALASPFAGRTARRPLGGTRSILLREVEASVGQGSLEEGSDVEAGGHRPVEEAAGRRLEPTGHERVRDR